MKLTTKKLKNMIQEGISESTRGSIGQRIHGKEYGGREDRFLNEMVIISADRGEFSPKENDERYNEMVTTVSDAGYPYVKLQGKWVETDRETGEKREVRENSIMITDDERPDKPRLESADLFELGQQISKKYDQEAFIFGEIATSKRGQNDFHVIQAYNQSGEVQNWGGPWTSVKAVKEDEEFWSRVRGSKPFQLSEEDSEVHSAPSSMMEAMKISYTAKAKGRKVRFIRGKK